MLQVCFAASPFHLICIKELINRNKQEKYIIYCLIQSRDNSLYKQIIRSIEFLGLENIVEVKLPKNIFSQLIYRLIFGYSLTQKYKGKPLNFIIFDFRNTFMHYLRKLFPHSKFILIDDGFATYESYNEYIRDGKFLPYKLFRGFKGRFNKLLHFNVDFNYLLQSKIEIFTIYALELGLSKNSFNDMSYLRKLANGNNYQYSNELVYFAGARLSEKGGITLEEEIEIIKKINDYWLKRAKKMIYVGKRVDVSSSSGEKIRKIEAESIPVIFSDLPFELFLIESKPKEVASNICSFGSTLNQTIKLIFKETGVYIVESEQIKQLMSSSFDRDMKDKNKKITIKKIKTETEV